MERYLRSAWEDLDNHREGRHKPIGQDNEQCDSRWREEAVTVPRLDKAC
ncbi:MAG: hypothetical protein KIIPBIDF_01167 [Candidatus Methanoperedenaceae archaeon GB50]|nr:MAG: hypothetical protein KIIPBIDF_01167 [Candidatus Methanoperedenaceae archaeon GB50]